jgi:hypothetical protein
MPTFRYYPFRYAESCSDGRRTPADSSLTKRSKPLAVYILPVFYLRISLAHTRQRNANLC